MNLNEFIKPEKFFKKYAPLITNWRHKFYRRSSKGKEISFTELDKRMIKGGINRLCDDLKKTV